MLCCPEEAPRMREIVMEETIRDMDTNNDDFVTLDEYLSELVS